MEKTGFNLFKGIKRKLFALALTTCLFAMILMAIVLLSYDSIEFRKNAVIDLGTVAEVIGTNSSAALRFRYQAAAKEILSALSVKKHIRKAFIYNRQGEAFASYPPDTMPDETIPVLTGNTHRFENDRLHLVREIVAKGEPIGQIYIQSDLEELDARFWRYLTVVFGVFVLSILLASLLVVNLQKAITEPIRNLARVAKRVSIKKDYSLRAMDYTDGEIGILTDSFNDMLSIIQERDTALQNAHQQVEKQARKLKENEERLRDLFDNAPDIYIILDPVGRIVDVNKRGLKRLGYSPAEVVGRPMTNIMSPEDASHAEMVMNKILAGRPPKNMEARLINKNGDMRWVIKEFSLLKDQNNNILNIRVICRDITERKRLSEELERAHRLETAGRIAGQIAHDFNNLLGPLAAYPAMIREDLPLGHSVLGMVDEMEHAANKIAEINQQLLSLGRRGHYSVAPIDLNDLLDKLLSSQHQIDKTNIIVEKHFAKDLFMLSGGAAQLTRALSNLFNNAIEAMQGRGRLNVSTKNIYLDKPLSGYKTVNCGEYIKLEISDSGIGIPPEILNKIFDPFFSTKTMDKIRGSGLGLSVVHGIVEDHQGYITVDSEVGEGTGFTLYFPVVRDAKPEVTKIVEEVCGGHEMILIVDDDPVQRKVTGFLLKRLGYRIQTAVSGEQAVEFVTKQKPDLLILDMVMDGIDGAETYRRVLQENPGQKAIILSGYAMSKLVKRTMRLGAGMFVSKPISLVKLANAVRTELDKPGNAAVKACAKAKAEAEYEF